MVEAFTIWGVEARGSDDGRTALAHLRTPSGAVISIQEGARMVFGRGPGVELLVRAGRGLSRRAGLVVAVSGGVYIANLSHTHALYIETEGQRIRLPRLEQPGEPLGGWFQRAGTTAIGSRAMLDEGDAIAIEIAQAPGELIGTMGGAGEATLLPMTLDPGTKLYLTALLLCRPWLIDPSRTTPLPRVPEITRMALELTNAHRELTRFTDDSGYRERLTARVGEHLRALRRKILDRGLVRQGTRLSDEVVVEVLIEHAIIGQGDLRRLDDPAWRSRQEDLWWHEAAD
jgi:hypothetical protein